MQRLRNPFGSVDEIFILLHPPQTTFDRLVPLSTCQSYDMMTSGDWSCPPVKADLSEWARQHPEGLDSTHQLMSGCLDQMASRVCFASLFPTGNTTLAKQVIVCFHFKAAFFFGKWYLLHTVFRKCYFINTQDPCKDEKAVFGHRGTFWDWPNLYKRDGLRLNHTGIRLLVHLVH